ncbi:MAG: hypothetical protein R3F11_21395 [Verrucomicrobiales bacterium]
MRAARDRDYDAFQARLRELETLSASELEALLGKLDPKDAAYQALFELLVRADPKRAFAFGEQLEEGRGSALLSMALYRWSAVDPRAAWAAVRSLEGERRPGFLEGEVLGQWAKDDLNGALEAWAELSENLQSSSFTRIADAHARDPESRDKLLDFLTKQPSGSGRSWAFANVLQTWAKDAPLSEIATWIDSEAGQHEAGEIADFERKVAGVAVQREPKAAIDWLMSRSSPERRSEDLEALVGLWAVSEPNAAGEWLGSLTMGPDTDAAVATFARRIRRDDPESALEWARRIDDPALRDEVSNNVLRVWDDVDPGAAPRDDESRNRTQPTPSTVGRENSARSPGRSNVQSASSGFTWRRQHSSTPS